MWNDIKLVKCVHSSKTLSRVHKTQMENRKQKKGK